MKAYIYNVIIDSIYFPLFCSYMQLPSLDAKLSDICLGTSAAPSELPPYYFKDGDDEFNLVDGVLVANSPVS